jgi:hypothetical protein
MEFYKHKVIIKRWQDFTGEKATHEDSGKTYEELSATAVVE